MTFSSVLALASGVPLVLLGAWLLTVRPRQRQVVFFALFAVAWGLQVAAANLGIAAGSPRLHAAGLTLSFAFAAAAWIFLTYFATLHAPRLAWVAGGMVAWALAGSAVGLLAPHLLVRGVALRDGLVATSFGPAVFPLVNLPFFVGFYATFLLLYLGYRRAAPGTARFRARALLAALGFYLAYTSVRQLFVVAAPPPSVDFALRWPVAALFLGGTALVVGVAAHLAARPHLGEGRDRGLLLALAVPVAVAALEGLLAPQVETVGLWRLLTVAALAHALARHQLFDLDLRLKPLAGAAIAVVLLLTGAVVAAARVAGGGPPQAALPPLGLAALAAGGAVAFRRALGEALFPGVADAPDYLRRRKLEVYRAALEDRLAGGRDDDEALRRLRRDLDISPREHEVMAFMAASRLPARLPSQPDRVEPGARVAGRYRVDRLLGEGGYGRAFLAHDEQSARPVVIKVVANVALGGAASAGLVREARILAELAHPNVIGVHEVLETPHETLLVLEYAEGGSLAGLLARRAPLPPSEAERVLRGILEGLSAAHARGIVHRDVKPENVLLSADGTVKLADFGIARVERPDATGITGAVAGTLLYMAPEQVRGRAADARSDLYAAAVVFHLCLTGRYYLRIAGKDDFQVRQLILGGEPQLAVRDAPAWVEPFLFRGLAKDPADRFPSAAAMLAAMGGPREAPSLPA